MPVTDDRPPADDPLGTLLFEMTVVDDSTSPLQLVSAELLAYYRQRDAQLTKLLLETAENKLAANCQFCKQVVDL